MKPVLVAILLFLVLTPRSGRAAGISVASALPRGSQLLLQVKVAGYRHAVAVAYRSRDTRVGVVSLGSAHDRLVWSASLTGAPRRLVSPGPAGVFLVFSESGSRPGSLFAYRLHAGRILPALPHAQGRQITASSFHAKKRSLVVSAPDTAHRGSIPYQYRITMTWGESVYIVQSRVHRPAMKPDAYPRPNGVVHLKNGNTVLMKLETAWTLAEQEHGLMDRSSLDPDSGMVFVWPSLVGYTFTMNNTLIPLTVAFLAPDGTILFTQDMTPLDSTTPYGPDSSHCASRAPGQCYQFAIEMNKGFFADNGIQVGDKVVLTLPCGSFKGFHSPSVKCYS